MVPAAPFLLSLATLNASLAGLGGLLVGLRRASGFDPLDSLRLRQVVEFVFANLLLAIAVQPLAQLLRRRLGDRQRRTQHDHIRLVSRPPQVDENAGARPFGRAPGRWEGC